MNSNEVKITHYFVPKDSNKIIAAKEDGKNFKNSVTGEYLEHGSIYPKETLVQLMNNLKK